MAFFSKKEESTNDKIIRLFQEGKSVEDIVGEVALRADIVTGVIQRKLGADAVPDAAVPHERSQAAAMINSVSGSPAAAAPAETESEDVEGMSKLERYMFEKKIKRVFVTREGKLVGVISRNAFTKLLLEQLKDK